MTRHEPQLLLWDHAGSKEVEGIRERREAERTLWLAGVSGAAKAA